MFNNIIVITPCQLGIIASSSHVTENVAFTKSNQLLAVFLLLLGSFFSIANPGC